MECTSENLKKIAETGHDPSYMYRYYRKKTEVFAFILHESLNKGTLFQEMRYRHI